VSEINDVIASVCANGVQFKTLGELGATYSGLVGKSKADFNDGNARYVAYSSIYNNLSVNVRPTDFVRVQAGEKQNALRLGDVLFTASSETPDDVGMSSVVIEKPTEPVYLNSFCFGYRLNDPSLLLPGFARYVFRADEVRRAIARSASGVTRFNISKGRFLKVRIPLPPIEVQREIVKVLDSFTQLEAALEAQLEAELEARRRQYQHYHDALLRFSEGAGGDAGSQVGNKWSKLGDLVEFINGKPHERLVDSEGGISLMTSKFISTQGKSSRFVKQEDVLTPALANDIALVMSDLPKGRALARAYFVDKSNRYAANQRVCLLRVPEQQQIDPRFLYYIVNRNQQLLKYDSGVDQTHLKKEWILQIQVPVPHLEEQRRIVATLDQLDALVSDLSVHLSTELKARRQQYEYYRDRLLTFREAA
jgi:type I restriction enzyme S subunit